MIVDTGLQHIADQLAEKNQAVMSHMAVGTGSAAETAGDLALQTETARVALTAITRSDKKVVYVGNFTAGVGTGTLTEVGLFNATTAGDLLSRIVFSAKNKSPNDTLQITIEHTLAGL